MTGGARRAAARRRVHNVAAGRIRIGVAIVVGGAFGALVVLWAGLGPSTTDGGRTPSANERPCGAPEGCASTTSPPVTPGGPGATVSSTPSAPSAGIPPRMRRPAATEPADGPGADARSPWPHPTSTPDPADPDGPAGPVDPSASPTGSAGPAPTSTSSGPADVIVDIPPIILPTCILVC